MLIPTHFDIIMNVLSKDLLTRSQALTLIDALLAQLPRARAKQHEPVLCACNCFWLSRDKDGKPVGEDGHDWDDCADEI